MSNPWDIPPWPSDGDADEDELYRMVGKALTSWEFVEEAVAEIFGILTGAADELPPTPAIRAYGSVVSFRGRKEMVEAAAKAFFRGLPDDGSERQLMTFLAQSVEWSGRRNEIAHGKVVPVSHLLPSGFGLIPGLHNTRKHPIGERPRYCYGVANINRFREGFDDLYDRLRDYRNTLRDVQRKRLEVIRQQVSELIRLGTPDQSGPTATQPPPESSQE